MKIYRNCTITGYDTDEEYDLSLYRFVNINQLQKIFDSCSFRLKRPILWKDKWEGFPFELLDGPRGKKKVKYYLKTNRIPFNEDIITLLKATVYCICFTKTAESEALWNAYYPDANVVRIEIKKQKFTDEFEIEPYRKLKDVVYVKDSITESYLINKLRTIIFRDGSATKTVPINGYIFKREEQYGWENECRFLLYEPRNLTLQVPGLNQRVFHTQSTKNIKDISVPDEIMIQISGPLNDIVNSVLVHPYADEHFCKKIKELCRSVGVNYSGKSAMNSPPYL